MEQTNIRLLSMYQPFASLMLPPYNKKETRKVRVGRKCLYPNGTYVICSTVKPTPEETLKEWCGDEMYEKVKKLMADEPTSTKNGYALMVAELYSVRPMRLEDECDAYVQYKGIWKEKDKNGVWHEYQQMILEFWERKPIEPFPIKGGQGAPYILPEDLKKIKYL